MPEYHIYIGADHRGFQKKEDLLPLIRDCHENVIVEDLGAESLVEDDDFNDPALAVAKAVAGESISGQPGNDGECDGGGSGAVG